MYSQLSVGEDVQPTFQLAKPENLNNISQTSSYRRTARKALQPQRIFEFFKQITYLLVETRQPFFKILYLTSQLKVGST
jgi:hypothetical protein